MLYFIRVAWMRRVVIVVGLVKSRFFSLLSQLDQVFVSVMFRHSCICSYEGTGRFLSQKLIQDLQASSTIGSELDLRKFFDTMKSAKRIGPPLLS